MTEPQTKVCQNCKQSFVIEPDDFVFYERIQVPPPTFCPECRMKRRMLFRNEFTLYKCECALCGKKTISHFSGKVSFPIYCNECWWSDKWDPMDYGREYDPDKNFFAQWKELSDVVPRPDLEAYQNENCPYSDYTWFSKNVYLSPSTISSENVAYSKGAWRCRDVLDSMVILASENVYEAMDSERCTNCKFISDCKDCADSSFLFDCRNCSHCFMSRNLRNKRFVFRNKQLTEGEYKKEMEKLGRDYAAQREFSAEYVRLRENALHKYANMIKCVNSSGNNLSNCKNARYCFNSESCEDAKYGVQMSHAKDVQDMYGVGDKDASLLYEGVNVGYLDSNIYFSLNTFENCTQAQYCDYCRGSQNLFGCIGLRKKQYCILNRQYEKDAYHALQQKIMEDMNANPYTDSRGNIYRYGEFFPVDFSPHSYNEAMTQFYFPTKREEAAEQGYVWMDQKSREYSATKKADELPNTIEETSDGILEESIACAHKQKCGHNCTFAFRITPQELLFYRKMKLPIPHLCSACRNGERASLHSPSKLWHRQCMCDKTNHAHQGHCPNEFETSYAPDREEVVYCEQCYQAEVI